VRTHPLISQRTCSGPSAQSGSAPQKQLRFEKEYRIMTTFPHASSLSENAPAHNEGQQSEGEKPLDDIIAGVDIQNLVEQRTAAIHNIRQALDLINEAEKLAVQAYLGFPALKIGNHHRHALDLTGHFANPADIETAISKAIDAGAWKFLLDASKLSRFMDTAEHKRWDDIIYSDNTPELTMTAITETFTRLHAERGAMFERKVMEIFRALSWDHQGGLLHMLGKKLIVRYLVQDGSWPQSDAINKVEDLECAFCMLDGKPESGKRDVIHAGILEACHSGTAEMETKYLHIHWFQNGNGHITFKRHDLVTQLNNILTKHYPDASPVMAGKQARG
jgi:hypothetical protein